MDSTFQITVNGKSHSITTNPDRPLLDVLREDLQLTGTKFGCGQATCAACTVLLNDKRIYSCITPISDAAEGKIRTVEGLATGEKLHPVQQAFMDEGSFQCGYCNSGMIMSTVALLESNPHPTDEQIVSFMNRNICRCCTYHKAMNSIKRAAAQMGR